MTTDPVVIASYARTPMGGMQGVLSGVSATQLGATAIKAAVERAGVKPEAVDQVIMGCVLPGALGQAPARQATLGAGLPMSVGATTINKVCGSGMKATMMAAEAIIAGTSDIVVAGGMESMTNAPYMLTKHRSGARLGHDSLKDSMFLDGLEDAYEPGRAMGSFAEETCTEYQFTREAQDEYALRSLSRANEAIASGAFDREIVPALGSNRLSKLSPLDIDRFYTKLRKRGLSSSTIRQRRPATSPTRFGSENPCVAAARQNILPVRSAKASRPTPAPPRS